MQSTTLPFPIFFLLLMAGYLFHGHHSTLRSYYITSPYIHTHSTTTVSGEKVRSLSLSTNLLFYVKVQEYSARQ